MATRLVNIIITPETNMDIFSIFKAIIRSLSTFGVWGWVDLIGASIVVLGCAGELWVLLNKLPEHNERRESLKGFWRLLAWTESRIRPIGLKLKIIRRRKFSDLKEHLLEGLFISLVAFGVGMELVSLPFSLKEGADINEKAGIAMERAEKLAKETEELRTANLKLYEQIKPRRITPEQKDAIITKLLVWRASMDRCDVRVRVSPTDTEARIFAEQIGEVLGQVFNVITDEGFNATPPSGFGTRFSYHDPPSASARAIARALVVAPIAPISVEISTNVPSGTLFIDVLPKPLE